jgi:antitoxin YefM
MTIHISYDQAQQDLAKLIDRVADDREIVIIDRPGSEGVALVAAHELSGLLETAHLLRSPRNAERLLTALNRARAGNVAPRTVEQLREEVGLGSEKKD